ncbi:TetR/AcrR family transcriptional regulator [Nocardioides sp. W7]|uniref:TetR/AcrR family transcriptional regulator n=1 Tax=Nocardioides sp. W7 TaxID=2931390 RepID=UPI001FD5FB8B|nr:TetR/AcrR family transcriptional regulator [Nocardioides sp. W7]
MDAPGQVVQQVLSPARAATRARLIQATIDLAAEDGYDAVTIRQIAARAGVSTPTAYQHASSKDQLLLEALMELGRRSTAQVREHPPQAGSAAERLIGVFDRILRQAAAKPRLYHALYRGYVGSTGAMISSDTVIGFGPENAAWIGETLRAGESEVPAAIESTARILSCLFLGTMLNVAAGRPVAEVMEILADAAHRLLD